jgi:hypothetical protein
MSLSIFVARQLEQSLNKVIQEDYPEFQIMTGDGASIFPINQSLDPNEPYYTYQIMKSTGVAEFLVNGGDDIPTGSFSVQEITGTIKDIGFGFSYSDREINLARKKGVPLKEYHLENAKRAHDIKLEDTFYFGASSHNLYGIFNFPGIPMETLLADGAGSSTTLASKTPEQKYRDICQMIDRMSERSKRLYHPEILMLDDVTFNELARTLLPNNSSGGRTILQTIMDNQRLNPRGLKRIIPNPRLRGIGTGGTNKALLYTRNENYFECMLPAYMEVSPESEMRNYKLHVNTRSTVGGTVVYKLLSVSIFDGV